MTLDHDPQEPMDDVDEQLLADLARLYAAVDPVPEGLALRSLFTATLAGLESEVLELVDAPAALATVRGEAPVEARTITFTSESATIMITLSPDDGGVRVDGWVAPAGELQVELRSPGEVRRTTTDHDGRFVLTRTGRGPASLVVRRPDGTAVSSPVIEI
ncbi:hypothetical protein [Cellulomonas sp. PhB143]|uniref:hypothetical protein n=1 Tax=Cellulomonas sp. PhB143 TaxID=2485186 RepID=UPI000F4A2001|nr:hypothetical protein [Cellulomonas sp. PhB143]ROS76766.1 hypothetical protein EDF32_1592 [Cellulomonas sp. PhB143]